MPEVTVVLGDITKQEVGAVVNDASTRMRGAGSTELSIELAVP